MGTRRYIAFDWESFLIAPGVPSPEPVCMSYAEGGEVDLVTAEDAWPLLMAWLADPDVVLIGANVAFDFGIAITWAPDADAMTAAVFAAYDAERIRDVQVRDKLLMLADGRLSFDPITNKVPSFSLGALSERYLGTTMAKGEDTWRLRYGELAGVPIHEYPAEALTYALTDALSTLDVFLAQNERGTAPRLSGDLFVNESEQTDAAWSLHILSMTGLEVDLDGLAALKLDLEASIVEVHGRMRAAGILRPDGTKNMKVLKERVSTAYAALGTTPPATEKGAVSTASETLLGSGDALLVEVGEASGAEKLLSAFIPTLAEGIVNPRYDVLKETGRTSAFNPNIQQQPRKGGIRELYRPPAGYAFLDADYSTVELVALAQACLDLFGHSAMADAINAGKDLHLVTAATLLGISYEECVARYKAGDEEAEGTRQTSKCFHPDTEVLTHAGWRRIADLRPGEEVLAAQPNAGGEVEVSWEAPTDLTRRHAPELVHLKNKGIDLRVTPDHRMVAYPLTSKGLGRRRQPGDVVAIGEPQVLRPEQMPNVRYFPSAGRLDNPAGDVVDERLLRLAVAAQADGSYDSGGAIRFGFSKQRKVERLLALLNPEERSVAPTSQGAVNIRLNAAFSAQVRALLDEDKTFPWSWLNLTPRLRDVVLDEVEHWDSYTGSHRSDGKKSGAGVVQATLYSTTLRKNADVLQALGVLSGRKSRLNRVKEAKGTRSDCWGLSLKKGHLTRGGSMSATRIEHNADVVCLSVPSTFVVVRDGGIPIVTGQCLNFGLPGGMGADAFVEFARGYGLILERDFVAEVKTGWLATYPEMQEYFAYIGRLAGVAESFDLTQLRSGRVRGGCRYTAGCNSLFQGLAADGAKLALHYIVRECLLPGPSPLYGCLPHAFVHDEVLLSAPVDRVHEAAARLEVLMVAGMRHYTPDVAVRVDIEAADRWSKKAKRVLDANGRLTVWTPSPEVPQPSKQSKPSVKAASDLSERAWRDEEATKNLHAAQRELAELDGTNDPGGWRRENALAAIEQAENTLGMYK